MVLDLALRAAHVQFYNKINKTCRFHLYTVSNKLFQYRVNTIVQLIACFLVVDVADW